MKNLSARDAIKILNPIGHNHAAGHLPTAADQQSLIDGMDHPDSSVYGMAFTIVEGLSDKSPYEAALISHAGNHTDISRAMEAYLAMTRAQDVSPFALVIKAGCRSKTEVLALNALFPLYNYVFRNKSLPTECHEALKTTMDHAHYSVAIKSFATLSLIHDKNPFLLALQNVAQYGRWPDTRREAVDMLKKMASPSMTPTSNPDELIKDVRLDFNIVNNGKGIGPDEHRHAAVEKLTLLFKKSTPVQARIFYDPNGKLPENSIIAVALTEADKNAILTSTLKGIAPAMNVKKGSDGRYTASLSPA